MTISVAAFIVSLGLLQRLRKLARTNDVPDLQRIYFIAMVIAVLMFILESSLGIQDIMRWVWDIFLVAIIVYSFTQKKLWVPRMNLWAFLPFIIISIVSHITKAIDYELFSKWKDYAENGLGLSFIWMAALLFSQNRQDKNTEKERVKKQLEDEHNKAIAIRKVELEQLVTERTSELKQQKDELLSALTDLRVTQTQLIQSEKMASLGELTAGIAHEIQNPLNFVNNFSELNNELIEELKLERAKPITERDIQLEESLLNDITQNLEKINHHGKRADAIVKGMLQHSRSSTGQKEPTDINALADEYLRLAYHGLRAKDKSFNAMMKTDFDGSITEINIIPQDIGRVILNLITNAFYAVNEKKNSGNPPAGYEPTVTVSTKKLKDHVSITVADNANGIPPQVIEKIFQPFFTTKPTGAGTGLGLSMSYDIITKGHNGDIKVETKEGEGSKFIITLHI